MANAGRIPPAGEHHRRPHSRSSAGVREFSSPPGGLNPRGSSPSAENASTARMRMSRSSAADSDAHSSWRQPWIPSPVAARRDLAERVRIQLAVDRLDEERRGQPVAAERVEQPRQRLGHRRVGPERHIGGFDACARAREPRQDCRSSGRARSATRLARICPRRHRTPHRRNTSRRWQVQHKLLASPWSPAAPAASAARSCARSPPTATGSWQATSPTARPSEAALAVHLDVTDSDSVDAAVTARRARARADRDPRQHRRLG